MRLTQLPFLSRRFQMSTLRRYFKEWTEELVFIHIRFLEHFQNRCAFADHNISVIKIEIPLYPA